MHFHSILDAVFVRPQFSLKRFGKAVQTAGLWDTLNTLDGNSFTVFAPRNVAFFDFETDDLSPEQLKEVLESHIIFGEVRFEAMKEGANDYKSIRGSPITVNKEGNRATITTSKGTANIKKFDILTKNGVIHIIDKVL